MVKRIAMTTSTISDALHPIADLARRVNWVAAHLGSRAVGEGREQENESLIEETAGLIQSLDDILCAGAGQELQENDVFAMARALRTAAFLLMARINPSQAWFWTEEWQAGEREVDANIAAGNLIHFASDEDFLAALDALDAENA
jgi:hypothetical protein